MPVKPPAPKALACRLFQCLRLLLAGFFLCVLMSNTLPAMAAGVLDMQTDENNNISWNLTADRMDALSDAEVLEAFGNVVLQRGTEYLKADYARYYHSTRWVYVSGNVEVHFGEDTIKASEAEFDLGNRTGWLKNGEIFMAGPHTYVSGSHIDKHWGDVYSFKNAKFTSCDGDSPAWSFTADEAVVELDGYAQLWNTAFQIKDVPVMSVPFMVVPVKKERQSGFLLPEVGYGSMRGVYYNQPYFWAIDDSRDLTLNEYFMSNRGFMQGLEYRSRASETEQFWGRFDIMYDKRRVTSDSEDRYFSGDGLVRDNNLRFWLRGMYDANLPGPAKQWQFRSNFDYVSDAYFLREFDNGFSGYGASRDNLFNLFNRDLTESDTNRVSTALLFRDWERATLAFSGTYTQNINLSNGNLKPSLDTTVQTLPEVDFFLHKGRILQDLPLEIYGSAQGAYMFRRTGTRGARYDLSPGLAMPLNGKYGSLRLEAALGQTIYQTEVGPYENRDHHETGTTRTLPSFGMDASTELVRDFLMNSDVSQAKFAAESPVGTTRWTGVRHLVQPRVGYVNLRQQNQDRNPYYDAYDRIEGRNEIIYSLDNVLVRRREAVQTQKDASGKEEKYVTADYQEFFRLRLAQIYDIKESKRTEQLDEYERQPFRDIVVEASIVASTYFSLNNRTDISPYSGKITRHSHGANLNVPGWGNLYGGMTFLKKTDDYYRKWQEDTALVTLSGNVDIYGPWSAGFFYNWDLKGDLEASKGLEVTYTDQCYQISAMVWRNERETSYQLMFSLNGLGGVGFK